MKNNPLLSVLLFQCKRRNIEIEQKGSDRVYLYKGGAEYLILVKESGYEVYFSNEFVFHNADPDEVLDFILI